MTDSPGQSVVLITGASGGLGRALVEQFISGQRQVFAGRRLPATAPETRRVMEVFIDVTQRGQIADAIRSIITQFGRIDALVNNAGVTADDSCWQMSDEDSQRVPDVNLRGAFLCSQAVSRQMIRQREGHIINISSFGARSGPRGQANYAAAKAGIIGLAQSLAKELGSRNVRVNAALPGMLPTTMPAKPTAEQLDTFARANVLGRINAVNEVARFIVFLATTQNISGQIFQLDSRIAPWT